MSGRTGKAGDKENEEIGLEMEMEVEQELEEDMDMSEEGGDEGDEFDYTGMGEQMMLGDMLNTVLGNYLEYRSENGTLNLADALLLLRNSVEAQNELIAKQTEILGDIAATLKKTKK